MIYKKLYAKTKFYKINTLSGRVAGRREKMLKMSTNMAHLL